jgi:hypothetical protein
MICCTYQGAKASLKSIKEFVKIKQKIDPVKIGTKVVEHKDCYFCGGISDFKNTSVQPKGEKRS